MALVMILMAGSHVLCGWGHWWYYTSARRVVKLQPRFIPQLAHRIVHHKSAEHVIVIQNHTINLCVITNHSLCNSKQIQNKTIVCHCNSNNHKSQNVIGLQTQWSVMHINQEWLAALLHVHVVLGVGSPTVVIARVLLYSMCPHGWIEGYYTFIVTEY